MWSYSIKCSIILRHLYESCIQFRKPVGPPPTSRTPLLKGSPHLCSPFQSPSPSFLWMPGKNVRLFSDQTDRNLQQYATLAGHIVDNISAWLVQPKCTVVGRISSLKWSKLSPSGSWMEKVARWSNLDKKVRRTATQEHAAKASLSVSIHLLKFQLLRTHLLLSVNYLCFQICTCRWQWKQCTPLSSPLQVNPISFIVFRNYFSFCIMSSGFCITSSLHAERVKGQAFSVYIWCGLTPQNSNVGNTGLDINLWSTRYCL